MFLAFIYIPHWYKTQEICGNVVSEDPFMLLYSSSRYKTQQVSDEASEFWFRIVSLKNVKHLKKI